MSEWKEYKLKDLGILQRGRSRHRPRYAFHLYGGKYPFIQTGEIREATKFIKKFKQTYSEAGLEQSKLWPKGTLCITIAANIAELAILNFDACFPDSVLGFIPNKELADLDFIYYTLTHFQRELKHIGEGSVQDNINLGTFEDIVFPIPSLPEQKSIASILSSLDDKIDLLHRQNANLEKMAETLFRQWFVEEAKEDWEVFKMEKLISIVSGKGLKKESFIENGLYPILGANGEIGRTNEFLYNEKLIFTGRVGTLGNIFRIENEKVWLSDNTLIIRPLEYFNFIYFLLNNSRLEDYNVGSTQPLIRQSDIKKIEVLLPTKEILKEFESFADEIFRKIKSNQTQIRTLTALRDTLLPKLMNGEVRVL